MKVAVIGSRNFNDYELMQNVLDKINPVIIVSGGAKGADSLARRYAKETNINFVEILPNWKKYGRSAGFRRNEDIINGCDLVVAFWDGKSKGTKHSLLLAMKKSIETKIVRFK